jgi:hypothetical protein
VYLATGWAWTIVGEPMPLPFDAAGNLVQEKLFPHSVRGRRSKGH